MLLIDTYVGSSAIEGTGVFAGEPIMAGQHVWTLNPMFDRLISHEQYLASPKPLQDFVDRYAYFDQGLNAFLLDGDHSRFLNHSEWPAIEFRADGDGYATRDIASGEELTCDYRHFMSEVTILPSRVPSATVIAKGHLNGHGPDITA